MTAVPSSCSAGPINGLSPVQSSPVQDHFDSPWEKVKKVAQKIFDIMTETVWPYINNVGNIIGKSLKIVVLKCPELERKLGHIIVKIGLLAGVSCLLMVKTVHSNILSLIKNSQIHDTEGIVHNAISLAVNPFETLDALITFTGYLSELNVIPVISFFSLIGLPLAVGINGYMAIKEGYNTVRCGMNLHELPKSVDSKNVEIVKGFLRKKIDVTDDEKANIEKVFKDKNPTIEGEERQEGIDREVTLLKDRKINILSRHTDKKIVTIMQNLKRHLDSETVDFEIANKGLRDMSRLTVRKIVFGSLNSLVNLAFSVALAVSCIFPISAIVIPIVAIVKTLVALARHHHNHVWMDKGLEHPQFLVA
ncbi:MAG: hypothetical protein K940chlam7_00107 [Chlamydiae bacterium]|nr:hypothetical protein [Chlamydiota bacterium]